MVRGGKVKEMYELAGEGQSIHGIARSLGISRNTVRKYLCCPQVPTPQPRPRRGSKVDAYEPYIRQRLAEGVENCVVLLREIRAQGYSGGYTILKEFVKPCRLPRIPQATMRYETEPGEQAQVDFGRFRYLAPDDQERWVWAFVCVLSWSRALYVEFVDRADTPSFIRCHVNAWEHFGGVPRRGLYDNTKLVVLDRDEDGKPVWNERFLDFALQVGFEVKLCRPYRARTKGKTERGVGYVEGNFWPGARFTDLGDLNRQVLAWIATVADVRVHGTTHERPADRLAQERPRLGSLPSRERVAPFLREERKVGRDGFVRWGGAWYGVPWSWAGRTVGVQADLTTVQIFAGEERLAVHPRASSPGKQLIVPGQWDGLPMGDEKKRRSGSGASAGHRGGGGAVAF
jgi:transposase